MSEPAALPDGVVIDSVAVRKLRHRERVRLMELTSGEPDSHMLTVLRERPEHALCFVARRGNEVLGWSLVRWFKPPSERPRNAHISVFIAPEQRRQGLGRALTAAAAAFATGLGTVPWVSAAGDDQLAFYRNCAGVRIARTPFQTR